MQFWHMYIADVAVADRIATRTLIKTLLKIGVVDVANRRLDEVAATGNTIAIHRNDAMTRITGMA